MTRSSIQIFVIVSILILLSFSCKDAGVQPPDKTFTLTVDDASCTEVYLNIKIGAGITSRTVTLKRDTLVLFTRTLNDLETVVLDTNLLPNHTYSYTAQLTNNSLASSSTAKTMDTTSNDISWTSYTPGDGSCCSGLYDVQILSDTFAIAVGKIMQGGVTYNAAMWNGSIWTLKSISVNFQANMITPPLRGVFAFSATDIWVVGSFPIHGDGNSWTLYHLQDMGLSVSVSKGWGTSSSSMNFCGSAGSLVQYNGSSWVKIESGTTLDIQNIRGRWNERTNTWNILATASLPSITMGKEVFRIGNNTAEKLSLDGIAEPVSDIWFLPNRFYIAVGSGMYTKHTLNDSHWDTVSLGFDSFYKFGVAGNDRNDLIAVGGFGEVVHYNGMRWKSYFSETQIAGGNYYSVAMRGNLIIAVGETATEAKIVVGKRTN